MSTESIFNNCQFSFTLQTLATLDVFIIPKAHFFTLDTIAELTKYVHFENRFKLTFLFTFPSLLFLRKFFSMTSSGYYSKQWSTLEQKVQREISIHSLSSY